MRLAYLSPLNPIQSGISDYSEELLPWLVQWADVDVFVDGYKPTCSLPAGVSVIDARRFSSLASGYDGILYQMGNSPAHAYIYRAALRFPGLVVLHEHVLHHLISWMSWDRGDARAYLNEFRYCYGAEGEALARRIIKGQANVSFFGYPLSDRVIRSARGLIVHSEYVRQAVLRVRPDAPVRVVPMGVGLPPSASERRSAARQRLGIAPDALVIGSFGHLNPFKRLDVSLRAFRRLRTTYPSAIYLLVGSLSPNYDVKNTVAVLGLDPCVRVAGYADASAFQDYVAATDICINLRHPTAGETSASVLRLMGARLPVLVSCTGTFEELPDDACLKVDVDECEGGLVLEYLRLLADDARLGERIGRNARRYVAAQHTMDEEAQGYIEALRAWLPGRVPAQAVRPLVPSDAVSVPRTDNAPQPPAAAEEAAETTPASETTALDDATLDLVAEAAAELGLGDGEADLLDAAQAWAELRRGA